VALGNGPAGKATPPRRRRPWCHRLPGWNRSRRPTDRTRTWLGPPYWANRLQDWRLSRGRLECVAASGPMRTRTVAVLTRELVAGDRPAARSPR